MLIHASKFKKKINFKHDLDQRPLNYGGIIGIVNIVDCVFSKNKKDCLSKWHAVHEYGFKLANPVPLEFYPCKGKLKIFKQAIPEILSTDAGVDVDKLKGELS